MSLSSITDNSEARNTAPISRKRSRSEKASVGPLEKFQGILGATLRAQQVILAMRKSILGMASHDFSNTKTTILRETAGTIPQLVETHRKDVLVPHAFSECFSSIGVVPARQTNGLPRQGCTSLTQASSDVWVLPDNLCKKDPCNFDTETFVSKSWQPKSNSWSASIQLDFVRALGRRKTARNRQGKIFYTELLTSWSTLGQFLANTPSHVKLQGSSLQ